ncbi:glycoside hydrolase family 16 [Micromonospora sp. L5]|uniref:family 16 glycosylhydrolase n=1 Tax=Micromonospora sp. (strain L5) TaxID=648999 RepID=UPI0001C47356|nr:family 16 glycosylhydrolase [Micromonospora sp. L5]ADU09665.1 glycoside hydrolase family 16 [Micromonospora sp. L5]
MNINNLVSPVRALAFRTWRSLTVFVPGRRVRAFGRGTGQIGAIIVINLDRQPRRWRRVTKELGRFRTSEGIPLTSITRRLAAVDARDGRAVAATVDVDVMYRIGDQLHVQPDARLAECFAEDEPVRMSRQEVAVARSHVEVWKAVANGTEDYVLVLEDDVWFKPGAPAAIDRGWRAALDRCTAEGGPKLLYLSYSDAGGTAARDEACDILFRPSRGLWFLSGYVLSRKGAAALLRAMPVVGPVDLWMNYRFAELGALALTSPAIAQRHDEASDNAYSVLPYLARAGIVDSGQGAKPPDLSRTGPVLAWTGGGEQESLAMALSMLGLRVRAFDGDEEPMHERELKEVLKTFDALVDAPLVPAALAAAVANERSVILLEADAQTPAGLELDQLPLSRSAVLAPRDSLGGSWRGLCGVLGLVEPIEPFPAGTPRAFRLFRDQRPTARLGTAARLRRDNFAMDDSPWVLPASSGWRPMQNARRSVRAAGLAIAKASMTEASASFPGLIETFPGNLASFAPEGLQHSDEGAQLVIDAIESGSRPYRSGAFASVRSFPHGRFEAEIRAAPGSGLVTGFFLHRDTPRQEIDIEFAGADPRRMLVNVYFNPGDDGTAMGFGYRGSPCRIDLGFDATADFHRYAIDWRPDRVTWLVDGRVVHERVGWDPTPIPHLKMRVHANLWAPRSDELAGRIDERKLPAAAAFRNVLVTE